MAETTCGLEEVNLIGYPNGQVGLIFLAYNKYFIDQACSVKMAGY